MKFRDAVGQAEHPVNTACKPGKKALERKHRNLVNCEEPQRITGSVNLDAALASLRKYASEPRWDYGLGYIPEDGRECALWVEVHTATTREVSAVLRKLRWLEQWLNSSADDLRKLTDSADEKNRFVWIASNGVHIPPNSRQARELNRSAIRKPRKTLNLP